MEAATLNYKTVSVVVSIVMAMVWIIYLHLALVQYRRANRPFLIIHHAHDNDPNALCLFVNMSREPVHLQCVIASLHRNQKTEARYVTDYDRITPDDQNVIARLRQGPIQPGGYLVLGTFEEIIAGFQTDPDTPRTDHISRIPCIDSLEVCVAVIHGSSKNCIGARRRFFVEGAAEKINIRPYSIHTEQLISWRRRRIVREWIEGHVDPKHIGADESITTRQSGKSPRYGSGR